VSRETSAGPAPPPPPLDDRGGLDAHIRCFECEYDLIGLDPDGVCPECGGSVDWPTRGNMLMFADPAWAARVTLGITIILWGMLAAVVSQVLVIVIIMLTTPALDLMHLTPLVVDPLLLVGIWMMTQPDPRAARGPGWTLGHWARLLISTDLAVDTVFSFGWVHHPAAGLVTMAIGGSACVCAVAWMARLASRVRADRLQRNLIRSAKLMTVALSVQFLCALARELPGASLLPAPVELISTVAAAASAASFLWWAVAAVSLRFRMKRTLVDGRAIRARHAADTG